MKRYITILALLSILVLPAAVWATEGDSQVKEIYTVDDLQSIADDPEGSYILMNHLDMAGVEWDCPEFRGSFDGNGYSIYNLYLTQCGEQTEMSYDGNLKSYETRFAGLFGVLRGAEVSNLTLLNVRALVDTQEPCFLGSIAGYCEDSTITDCTVSGSLELRAHNSIFGVGGIVGYGIGTIRRCKADVTLICTDTDPDTLDEQFMGGVFATGFLDVFDCKVTIDGYCSDFGYVHNGGITGMYMQQPLGKDKLGYVERNNVQGKITFFECNSDRRAYCKAIIGEIVAVNYSVYNNTDSFRKDERFTYDVELRPEMCVEPVYSVTAQEASCDSFGYSTFCCDSCGYSYTDRYTLEEHTVSQWTQTKAATTEAEGTSEGSCELCGVLVRRSEPRLQPEPTTVVTEPEPVETGELTLPTEPSETLPQQTQEKEPGILPLVISGAVVLISGVLLMVLFGGKKKGGKYLKRK